LYDLPSAQIGYVLDYLEQKYTELQSALTVRGNEESYRHLLSMMRSTLDRRQHEKNELTEIIVDPKKYGTDGLLAAPIAGVAPLDMPEAVLLEVARVAVHVPGFGERILSDLKSQIECLSPHGKWLSVIGEIDTILEKKTKNKSKV
jgi:hypothetical protein